MSIVKTERQPVKKKTRFFFGTSLDTTVKDKLISFWCQYFS